MLAFVLVARDQKIMIFYGSFQARTTCTVQFGVSCKILQVYARVPLLCTESMHVQSTVVCSAHFGMIVCTMASVDLLAYTCTYASVEIYCMFTTESWYNLRGGRILVQITPFAKLWPNITVHHYKYCIVTACDCLLSN